MPGDPGAVGAYRAKVRAQQADILTALADNARADVELWNAYARAERESELADVGVIPDEDASREPAD
jgi:hypothetical protein